MLEIVDFHEKSRILNTKNAEAPEATIQKRVQKWITITIILENLPKVEKSLQNHHRNCIAH